MVLSLSAGEFQVGKGTFYLKGGFAGLTKELDTDVTTFSLVEQHKNIFSSNWFYKFNFTWIDSDKLKQAQSSVNSGINRFNSSSSVIQIPSVEYRVKGLDINFVIGKDFINKDNEDTYLGAGLLLGASMPWIESDNSKQDNIDLAKKGYKILKDTKTKVMTFKMGLNVSGAKKIMPMVSIYGYGSWAYQTGRVKNSDVDTSIHINGEFREFDAGIRFEPISTKTKIGFITLSPKLYANLGYRYSYWRLNNIKINVTGVDFKFDKSDLEMKNSIIYAGVGYSF